jgi:hypothetical protein
VAATVRGRENMLEYHNQVIREEGEVISVCLQAGDWRLKRAWIGFKTGKLVPYFEYFDIFF